MVTAEYVFADVAEAHLLLESRTGKIVLRPDGAVGCRSTRVVDRVAVASIPFEHGAGSCQRRWPGRAGRSSSSS